MKFFISPQDKKLPQEARKSLLPRDEFIAQGKEKFLAAFDASPLAGASAGKNPAPAFHWTMFFRAGIGALAVICVAIGISAYADTANVPPTSPLYPLKRLEENVQLAVTPTDDQAQLQATFAVQRANEIDALQMQQPKSPMLPALTMDLDTEISSSLADANQATSSENGSLNVFCGAFLKSTSSVLFSHLEGGLILRPSILAQFNERCGSESSHGAQMGESATGTIPAVNSVEPIDPHGGGRDGHQPQQSETATTSATVIINATATPPILVPPPVMSGHPMIVATSSVSGNVHVPGGIL
jgi:hypothetical protein